MFNSQFKLVDTSRIGHKWYEVVFTMNFYTCFDEEGDIIARCQTSQDIEVLKRMGRPIKEVREMRREESVVCSLTGSPSDFNMDY